MQLPGSGVIAKKKPERRFQRTGLLAPPR